MMVERKVDGRDGEETEVEERRPVSYCVRREWEGDWRGGGDATVDCPAFLSVDWRREGGREGKIFVEELIGFVGVESGERSAVSQRHSGNEKSISAERGGNERFD